MTEEQKINYFNYFIDSLEILFIAIMAIVVYVIDYKVGIIWLLSVFSIKYIYDVDFYLWPIENIKYTTIRFITLLLPVIPAYILDLNYLYTFYLGLVILSKVIIKDLLTWSFFKFYLGIDYYIEEPEDDD